MLCVTDKSFNLLIILTLPSVQCYFNIIYNIVLQYLLNILIGFYFILIYMVFSLRFGEFSHFDHFALLYLYKNLPYFNYRKFNFIQRLVLDAHSYSL